MRDYITFEINKHFGVISTDSTGWTLELNLVTWNGGKPKFDIRQWNESHEHMSRGLTLTEEQMKSVVNILQENGVV